MSQLFVLCAHTSSVALGAAVGDIIVVVNSAVDAAVVVVIIVSSVH
jgi:hypothetical protein